MTGLVLSAQTECDCEFDIEPVCVLDENGDIIPLPNACIAECLGFSEEDFLDDCDFATGGDDQAMTNGEGMPFGLVNGNGQTPASPELTASPNPTADLVQLSWQSTAEGAYSWQLFDLNGRLIQQQSGYSYGEQEAINIDLSQEVDGIYLIRLQTVDGGETIKVTKF